MLFVYQKEKPLKRLEVAYLKIAVEYPGGNIPKPYCGSHRNHSKIVSS